MIVDWINQLRKSTINIVLWSESWLELHKHPKLINFLGEKFVYFVFGDAINVKHEKKTKLNAMEKQTKKNK